MNDATPTVVVAITAEKKARRLVVEVVVVVRVAAIVGVVLVVVVRFVGLLGVGDTSPSPYRTTERAATRNNVMDDIGWCFATMVGCCVRFD
jgi:hypothetical protein